MPVTREQVEQMAALARLRLTEQEVSVFTAQLDAILGHAEELADMAGGEEVGEALRTSRLRGDVPGADTLAFAPGSMAPAWTEDFFTLPRLPAMDGGEDPDDD